MSMLLIGHMQGMQVTSGCGGCDVMSFSPGSAMSRYVHPCFYCMQTQYVHMSGVYNQLIHLVGGVEETS